MDKENKLVNTKKIFVGQRIKNYKMMCDILGEHEKFGNSRKSQISKWEKFFLVEKEGNSIIIKEIYSNPKITPEKRGGNNRLEYIQNIEKLILDLMVQDRNNGKVVLSKYKLLNELNMINDNYAYCKRNVPKLSKFMNISEEDIYEFYDLSSDTLRNNLESALNKLKNQSLIYWGKAITLCIVQAKIETNELDHIRVKQIYQGLNEYGEEVYEYRTESNSMVEYRIASEDEIKIVLRTERDVMENLDCNSKQEIIRKGKWEDFSKQVNRELFEKLNILFYYDSYDLIFNEDHIKEKWLKMNEFMLPDVGRGVIQKELNLDIIDKLNINAGRRNKKSIEALDENFGDHSKVNIRRSGDNYIENNTNLIQTLVDGKFRNIKKDVRNVGKNKEESENN